MSFVVAYDPDNSPQPRTHGVLLQTSHGKCWLTRDTAIDLANRLLRATLAVRDIPQSLSTLAEVRANPGQELPVDQCKSNNRAYTRRLQLERDGFKCRCEKLATGAHVVYATLPKEKT